MTPRHRQHTPLIAITLASSVAAITLGIDSTGVATSRAATTQPRTVIFELFDGPSPGMPDG